MGTFLTQLATVWYVYDLTHSELLLGIVGFAGQIPMFLLAPVAGVWVDRWQLRRLLVITQALSMLQSLGLAAMAYFAGRDHQQFIVECFIGLAVCQGLINAFDMPARQAFLVEMVPRREDLGNAIALNSTMVHGARLVGPALAGFLIHYVGPSLCFLIDGCSYIAVIFALLAMHVLPRRRGRSERSVLAELKDGLRYAWQFRPIRVLLISMSLLSLTGMPAFTVLMPVFGEYFGGKAASAQTLGLLIGASGLGALVRRTLPGSAADCRRLGKSDGHRNVRVRPVTDRLRLLPSILAGDAGGSDRRLRHAAELRLRQHADPNADRRRHARPRDEPLRDGLRRHGPLGQPARGSRIKRHGQRRRQRRRRHFAHADVRRRNRPDRLRRFAFKLPGLRAIIRPIYVEKGILPPEIAEGMQVATEEVKGPEH